MPSLRQSLHTGPVYRAILRISPSRGWWMVVGGWLIVWLPTSPAELAPTRPFSIHHPSTIHLHPPALGRPAAVVRDWRHVGNRADGQPGGLQRPDGRLAARARSA